MTNEEAMRLKKGERVLVLRDKGRFSDEGRVVSVNVRNDGMVRVNVRLNRTRPSAPKGIILTFGVDVLTRPQDVDLVTPNVYADFLDEHGEHRAADLLRKVFPQSAIEGPTVGGEPSRRCAKRMRWKG